MLHRTFLRALAALPIALAAPAIAGAQTPDTDTPAQDIPAQEAPAQETVPAVAAIELGAPETVTIVPAGESGEGGVLLAGIASTAEQLSRGLAGRETFGEAEGVLFQYVSPRLVSRDMEDVMIPLDFIFIDAGGQVVKTVANAQPAAMRPLTSDFPVSAVLALPAGRAAALNALPGATVQHAAFGNLPEPEAAADEPAEELGTSEETVTESPQSDG